MLDIDLKAYTRKVKDLEVAIHTQKRLMIEHENVIAKNIPIEPEIPQTNFPKGPDSNDYYINSPYESSGLSSECKGFTSAMCVGIFIAGFVVMNDGGFGYGLFCIALSVLIAFGVYKYSQHKKHVMDVWREECSSKFHDAYAEYKKIVAEYKSELAVKQEILTLEYNEQLQEYKKEASKVLNKHKENIYISEKALADLYSENIIFPKYRNLIAITMINEYLESGRCSELEGANGAYNLYEMELRQNIIIGQLSSIIGNLEQIRNNQYSLYEELTKSNRLVQDVVYELQDLNNTTKLNAYFSYVTALVETSPKIYHGITY